MAFFGHNDERNPPRRAQPPVERERRRTPLVSGHKALPKLDQVVDSGAVALPTQAERRRVAHVPRLQLADPVPELAQLLVLASATPPETEAPAEEENQKRQNLAHGFSKRAPPCRHDEGERAMT